MDLQDYCDILKKHPNYNNKCSRDFPNPSKITEKPQQHINIIVEQAEVIIAAQNNPNIINDHLGIIPTDVDFVSLFRIFVNDIKQFSSENTELNLLEGNLFFGQNQIPSYTLFELSRSLIFPDTYEKHIDLNDQQRVFELYSIPFLIRLTIEKKLKANIGFNQSTIKLSDGQLKTSSQFPALKVINFLITSELIDCPISFKELKKIYNWSCKFVHTGEKEYIWLTLKAISMLNELFPENQSKYNRRISYLKDGVTLGSLQMAINNSREFSNPNEKKITEEFITLELSDEEFDDEFSFMDRRKMTQPPLR